MLDDHEVNKMKAFLLDWLIKFGRDYVDWHNIRTYMLESDGYEYAVWSFSIDSDFIIAKSTPSGLIYKLSKKGLKYINKE